MLTLQPQIIYVSEIYIRWDPKIEEEELQVFLQVFLKLCVLLSGKVKNRFSSWTSQG